MWTLSLMLSKMLMVRFVMILFGISAFVVTLDLVTYAEDVLALHDDDLWSIGHYAMLRLPGIISAFMGLSFLLAALMMLTEISHHSELVAIWNAGVSQFRMIIMLLPVAVVFGIANFFLSDRAVPTVAPVLHEWGIGDYSEKQLKVGEKDPIWMRSGNDVLRATGSNKQATSLTGVTIFRRDGEGLLIEQIMAEEAELQNGRWHLSGVVIYYRNNVPASRVEKMVYSGLMRPAAAGTRSGDPEEMSFADLAYFIDNSGFGIRPIHVYSTWLHKRSTLALTGVLMLLIAVPLAGRHRRGGGLGILFAVGIGLGFAYFVFDGISMTMGELGLLPSWMAAWLPMLVFALTSGTIAFRYETL
jgi:lipopolysaccharide export system permease protein